jgi:ferredoxin
MTKFKREQFQSNPSAFVEKVIKEYVTTSPGNQFRAFNSEPIFDEPLIGFANGDDTIFQDYKRVVADFHLTPREALVRHLRNKGINSDPESISVMSFIMPVNLQTRLGMRRETVLPSLRWNHTRWHGQDFIYDLSRYLVSMFEELGYQAIAPEVASFFTTKELPNGLASNWSQRHIAYAAGLGTFSLSDGFITAKGIAMRCGSVVTDALFPPSLRQYRNHLDNCLFYRDGSCQRCIERCPANAITERGHDKKKCREFLFGRQKEILKELGREEGYVGRYLGCGLCQTKVPCEAGIPPSLS